MKPLWVRQPGAWPRWMASLVPGIILCLAVALVSHGVEAAELRWLHRLCLETVALSILGFGEQRNGKPT